MQIESWEEQIQTQYIDLGDNLIHLNQAGITCSTKEVERRKQRRELGTMLIAILLQNNHSLSHVFPK
jgi:hypothetical protein